MVEYISKEVNLPELYKYALTKALQTNFTLTENAIDNIHNGILEELQAKCKKLVKEGLVTHDDLYIYLYYQANSILLRAKRANKKRKFSWNAKNINGLYNGFPSPVYKYDVVEGENTYTVMRKIKKWHEDFSYCYVGTQVGHNYAEMNEDLQLQKLLPDIFTSNKTSGSITYVNVNICSYISIHPIEMKLFAHDPNTVEMVTENLTLTAWKMKCSITKQGIRRLTSDVGNVEFVFPCYSKDDLHSTVEADIEFKATIEYKVKLWCFLGKWLFNTCKSKTFVHRMKLIIDTSDSSVKLREPVTIEISKEQADIFMDHHDHFKAISANARPPGNSVPSLLPGEAFLAMCERFPWLLFVETLRGGGVKAAMEMVKKKPEVLLNLPANKNNVLGITFEEFQIAKIMAESIRKKIPIELIAGDGHGQFRYNNKNMNTPEYTDAVFRKTGTDKYFSVQFKYADTAEGLNDLMQHWIQKWMAKVANDEYPDGLIFRNVKLLGPTDVVKAITEENIDVGDIVRRNFEQNPRIGFQYPTDETATMETFLRDNETLLKNVVNSVKYESYKRTKYNVSKQKKKLKSLCINVNKVHESVNKKSLKLGSASLTEKQTQGLQTGITKMNIDIAHMTKNIAKCEQTIKSDENEIKSIEKLWNAHFKEELTVTYTNNFDNRDMLKETALHVAVMATVDGLITLVCTFGDEWKKYDNKQISIGELVQVVMKETVIATARGASLGFTLSGLNMVAQYATANGFFYAKSLTVASKVACPIVMTGMLMKQSYDIIKHWKAKDITTPEMEKAFGRSITANGLSIGGMLLCGSAIGGPLGLVVGAGLAIAVGVGDYFLGDKVWSTIIKEDPKEAKGLKDRKRNDLCENVLHAAYDLLDLTECSTRDEIKEKHRVALLKYHPDKGGRPEIFHAVHAAYVFICDARHFDCVK